MPVVKNFKIKNINISLFSLFLLFHGLLWTLLPVILRSNPHLDTLEAFVWGSEWQLGYEKHPPLSAWFIELIFIALNKKVWLSYFASQICIILAFIAIWRLAKFFLNDSHRLLSVILLEGIYYYNFTSIEYNTNILLLAIWAWAILYSWKALSTNQLKYWIKLGIMLGLGMLTKYYIFLLCLSILGVMIFETDFRKNLYSYKPYLGALFSIIIFAPHFLWLATNDFSTISYMNLRLSQDHYFYNHFLTPLKFCASQLFSNLGALIIFFGAFFNQNLNYKNFILANILSDKKKVFLFFLGVGPFILTLLPPLVTAGNIKDMWGTPLWSLSGIIMFYFLQPKLNQLTLRRFYKIWLIITILMALIYSLTILINKDNKRDSFNGELAALEVNKLWNSVNPHYPLKIVVGEIWLASNISFFSTQKIHVLIDGEEKAAPWISYQDLYNQGGVIVWDANLEGEELPAKFKKKINSKIVMQYSLLIKSKAIRYKNQPSFKLGIAIIPPLASSLSSLSAIN